MRSCAAIAVAALPGINRGFVACMRKWRRPDFMALHPVKNAMIPFVREERKEEGKS